MRYQPLARLAAFVPFAPAVAATLAFGCSSASPTSPVGKDAGSDDSSSPASPTPADDSGAAAAANDDGGDATTTVTPTPVPTSTTPIGPPPGKPPPAWHAVVGATGFFGQTFDSISWSGRTIASGALYSVACADNTHGWASGSAGYVAHTADGGGTWTMQDPKLTSDLHAINFGWSNTGVVAGDAGALSVTQDGGDHWTPIAPLTTVALRGAAVAPYVGVMLVVGDGGTVLRSADSGATWTRATIAGAGDLHGVASDAWAGTVLAVDSLGGIWSSGDEGVTFTREASAGVSLDAVSTTQAGTRALTVGKGGIVLARSTAGKWATLSTGNAMDLHAALVDTLGRFFVAGESGTLLSSADLGAHWSLAPLGTTSALYGLQDL